jgi:hypothetical protein
VKGRGYGGIRDNYATEFAPDGEVAHEALSDQFLARTSLRVAVTQVPCGGYIIHVISTHQSFFLSFWCGKLVCGGPLNGGFGSGSPSSPLLPPRGLLRYRSLPFEWLLLFFLTILAGVFFQMCEYILWWGCCLLERGPRVWSLGEGGDPSRGGIA